MDYTFFKFIHLSSLILVVSFMAHLFLGGQTHKKIKHFLIATTALILFVTGFFLMGKIGFNFYDYFPFWIKIKIVIWFLVFMMGTILEKKAKFLYPKTFVFYFSLILIILSVVLSVYHPPTLDKLKDAMHNPIAVYSLFR